MAAALALAVTAVAILAYARGAICTPYVQTVQRMEALAAGDVDAPVRFTEYRDCVGRMTKAMAIFRNNALELRKGRAAEEREIINSLSDGLGHLAANNLEFRLEKPFPARTMPSGGISTRRPKPLPPRSSRCGPRPPGCWSEHRKSGPRRTILPSATNARRPASKKRRWP
jgi:hypothetical protein